VRAPRETADLLVALNEETVVLHQRDLSPEGFILADASLAMKDERVIPVPLKELSSDSYTNTAALGAACAVLGLEEEVAQRTLRDRLGEGRPKVLELNQEAFSKAYAWSVGQLASPLKLAPALRSEGRLLMTAHEAIALGAISAGVRFCAFYPMSPSTSVPMTMIRWADEMGLVVEQAEDEIAAVNMCIGASYAGAPSLVATSGGGFALMTEGVSLAGVTETPLVVVVAQRPGPGTGLATRTEQADLWLVLHGGHGEFPKAVFAPGSIEECFHLTRRAVELAERYQSPVFILTDHYMADSYRDTAPFAVEELPFVPAVADPSELEAPYLRYRITKDGLSPRLLTGLSGNLVVADSHEHTEDGHMTEDLSVRPRMVDKRMRKEDGLRAEVIPPTYVGDTPPEILMVCWGSSRGIVEEAAKILESKGRRVAAMHFSQLWPLIPEQILHRLEAAERVVSVESNATGQLAGLIRRETGFCIEERILRYDGLPLTPEYVIRALDA
jgi:2-oxoglutarate ferredoxin oxidoreductase subunit alpha